MLALPRVAAALLQAASEAPHPAHDRFLPHGFCYLWNPPLLWTHVVSDLLIGVSYVAISLTLAHLVHRVRRDIPFSWLFVAFGVFIVACGIGHFVEIWTLWQPRYWVAASVKVVTAAASVLTAAVLPFVAPRVIATIRDARLSRERQIAAGRAAAERASHELLLGVFEGTADPVFVKDRAGRYVLCNSAAAHAFARPVSEVLGRTDADLLAPALVESTRAGDARVLATGRTETYEVTAPVDGVSRTYLVTKGAHRDAAGAVAGVFGIARDITERKRGEAALARANQVLEQERARAEAASRAKSDFLATMSHELRTPLNAILGYTDLLSIGLPGSVTDGQQTYFARIEASGRHLLTLIDDVLDVSKIEAGELSVERRPVSLAEVLEGALALVRPQSEAKGVALVAAVPRPREARLVGDPDRVRQVMVNLLSNAVKFTPVGGRVDVAWRVTDRVPSPGEGSEAAGHWVEVVVRDTGIGIPAGKLEAIFEPFVQVDGGLNRTAGGTGLGLAISRRLTRLMGGHLTVQSELGRGSAFTLRLPVSTPAAEARMHLGERLLTQAPDVLGVFVEALRADARLPGVHDASRAALEGHVGTLLAALARDFTVLDERAADRGPLIADGGALKAMLAERHGAQRERLGWDEAALAREFGHLGAAIDRVLLGGRRELVIPHGTPSGSTLAASVVADQLALLRAFLAEVEVLATRGLREAAVPA